MLPVVLWVWYLSLVIEAVLLIRLVRWQVQLQFFGLYLCYDFPRWIVLAILDHWWAGTGYYARFWRWTEPVSIVLLWLAAIEAYRRAVKGTEPNRAHWLTACLGLVVLIVGSLTSGEQTYLAARGLVAGGAAAVLVMALSGGWDLHAFILTAFCAVDVIADASVLMGARNPRVSEFVIVGQAACLSAWLYFAPALARTIAKHDRFGV